MGSCIVYRQGTGTIEHGIECESTTCEIEHLDALLADGWSVNPPGYEPPEPVSVVPDEAPSTEEGSDSDELDALKEENRLLTELNDHLEAEVARLSQELDALRAGGDDEEEEEETDVNDDPAAIRQAAKDAGIEGWDTKRIATLKKALEA